RVHHRTAAAAVHFGSRPGGTRLRLPTLHDPADLRLCRKARHAVRRSSSRPRCQRLAFVLARHLPTDAARSGGRLHPRVHPGHRRLRHARSDGRNSRADDRQPHPEPVRRAWQHPAGQRDIDGPAGCGLRRGAGVYPMGPAGGTMRARPASGAAGSRTAEPTARDLVIDRQRLGRDLAVRRTGKIGLWLSPFLVYLFLWIPIVVLVVFSFNDGASVSVWNGFTTVWYENILKNTITAGTESARFQTGLLLAAVRNSLLVAGVATVLSTIMGTMLALA